MWIAVAADVPLLLSEAEVAVAEVPGIPSKTWLEVVGLADDVFCTVELVVV
jgi:hypothetical protein